MGTFGADSSGNLHSTMLHVAVERGYPGACSRGTKEMDQLCLLHLHVVSLV